MPRLPELDIAKRAVREGILTEAVLEECLAEKRRARADGLDLTLLELLENRGLVTRASWEALEKRAAVADTKSDEMPALPADDASLAADVARLRALHGTPPSDDLGSPRLIPAAEILGEYLIVKELGRGAMGVVYEAIQQRLGRRVALKVLPVGAAFSGIARERFLREARAAASLTHPNIVPIYDQGEERGVPFFAMELVRGRTLKEVFADEGPLEPLRAARLASQAARALQFAHERGLIHRDVKPDNLFLSEAEPGRTESGHDREERVLLADFGLALRIEDASLTREGTVVGTPLYMAPEQARGDRDKVDGRSDVYGLGATLHELLTAQPPFDGSPDTQTLLERIRNEDAAPLREKRKEVPAALEAIVLLALEKDPARRYQTAGALADDLDRFVAGEPVLARPPGTLERLHRLARKRARPLAAVASLLVFTAVVVALGIPVQRRWRADALVLQASNLERGGRRDEARARLKDALALVPTLADARARLAAFEIADGNVEGARASLERAVADDPESVEARLLRAELFFRAHDLEGALADDDAAAKAAPRDPRPVYGRGAVLAARGQWSDAATELERGLDLARDARGRAPDDKAYRQALRLAGEARLRSADQVGESGRADALARAETDLEEAIRLEPDAAEPRVLLGRTLVALGKDAVAVESFSDALRRAPDDPEALELRANALRRVGRTQDALHDIEAAVVHRPRVRFLRGLICSETPETEGEERDFDDERAREDLHFVLGLDSVGKRIGPSLLDAADGARANAALAWIELASGEPTPGRIARALESFDAALALEPSDLGLRLARGLVVVRGSHPGRARPDLEAARARPDLAYAATVGLAQLALAEKNPDGALALATRACELAPTRPSAHALRARLYTLAGDAEKARAERLASAGDAGAEARVAGQPLPLRRPLHDCADPLEAAERAASRGLEAFASSLRGSGSRFGVWASQACAYLRRALVLDPDRTPIALKLGDALYVLGRAKEAWTVYGHVLEQDPSLVEAQVVRGIVERDLLHEPDPRQAALTLEAAVTALERGAPAQDPQLGGRTLYELARAWEAAGEYDKALGRVEEACRIAPERHCAQALRARLLVRLGRPGADAAIELAAKLLHRPPSGIDKERALLFYRAGELQEQGSIPTSIHFFTRAIEAAPSVAASWRRRGERYFKSSPLEFPRAFVDLGTAMELDRANVDTMVDVEGKVYRFLPYAAELEQPVADILGSMPDLAASHFLAGFWELHKNDDARLADRKLTEALRLSPDWGAPYAYRALARARLHDIPGADRDMKRALELSGENALTVFFDACLALAKGDRERCYERLASAVELGFRYPERIRIAPELAPLVGEARFEKFLESIEPIDKHTVKRSSRTK